MTVASEKRMDHVVLYPSTSNFLSKVMIVLFFSFAVYCWHVLVEVDAMVLSMTSLG